MAKTIAIDESRCNGCGLCVEACHEGALALIDGKARLVKPNYCDGMGDCLPACPQGAISFKDDNPKLNAPRPQGALSAKKEDPKLRQPESQSALPGKQEDPKIGAPAAKPLISSGSNLMAVPGEQWPIQLALVSSKSDFLKGRLVIAADCTAFKVGNFRERFVNGDPIVIGCPKLDERERFDKFTEIFANNQINSVEVVRMEVPCCSALTRLVASAVDASGKDIQVKETVIARDGRILS
ncbi:4Fe-4S binding domain-containing protein [methanogenic archaeon mixed culture ISO4-G1]|nr:4Fe-4S binding domain-containing protein [methanogenic archaeon mixed culture ISO4-G1]